MSLSWHPSRIPTQLQKNIRVEEEASLKIANTNARNEYDNEDDDVVALRKSAWAPINEDGVDFEKIGKRKPSRVTQNKYTASTDSEDKRTLCRWALSMELFRKLIKSWNECWF